MVFPIFHLRYAGLYWEDTTKLQYWKAHPRVGRFTLPADAFVFSMHQGYEFNFFVICEGNDPPVYKYVEGGGPPVLVWDSFSACSLWILMREMTLPTQ